MFNNISKIFRVLNLVLLLILVLIAYIAFFIEKPKNASQSVLDGQRVSFQVKEIPDYNSPENQPVSMTADKEQAANNNTVNELLKAQQDNLNQHPESSNLAAPELDTPILPSSYISLIVTNLGANQDTINLALKLPSTITLGFLPTSKTSIDLAVASNHDVLIYLPIKDKNAKDNNELSSLYLDNKISIENNERRLSSLLNLSKEFVGFYTIGNDVFANKTSILDLLLKNLSDTGKFLINDMQKNNLSELYKTNKALFIDCNLTINSSSNEAIEQDFKKLEDFALKNGYAIAYVELNQTFVDFLNQWTDKIENKQITLTSISALANIIKYNNGSEK
jgi:polysaccharide deacetylase 2 family uncharacterized protein YibQ